MPFTDEMIIAYVDGELSDAAGAELETAMAADPDIARRVEAHRRLRSSLANVLGGVLNEPVPERLIAAIRRAPSPGPDVTPDNVVELARFRAKPEASAPRAVPRWMRWGAIAATVLVCATVGRWWFTLPGGQPLVVGPGGQMAAGGPLAAALTDQLASSGEVGPKPVVIGVSFRANDGRYCRTFQLNQGAGLAGVACREPQGWAVRMAMASPARAATTGYRTAATETPTPVLDAVQGMIDGDPLDAKAEARAKAAGWRP